MLVSLKALERSFTGEIRRTFYVLQNMKVPRPSGRGQWNRRDRKVHESSCTSKMQIGDQSRSVREELGTGDPASL